MWILGLKGLGKKVSFKSNLPSKKIHKSWTSTLDFFSGSDMKSFVGFYMWVNFILGLNYISLCFKLIIIHYHTPNQREIKSKLRIKLNHSIYMLP